MESTGTRAMAQTKNRSIGEVLKSYFYWTYPRGSFHYDVMVTLALIFIFATPHLWHYGDKPASTSTLAHPIQVTGDGGHGMIVTVAAQDVSVPLDAPEAVVKKTLREAIMPVTGDAVFVERWETKTDTQGNLEWKVWAHR